MRFNHWQQSSENAILKSILSNTLPPPFEGGRRSSIWFNYLGCLTSYQNKTLIYTNTYASGDVQDISNVCSLFFFFFFTRVGKEERRVERSRISWSLRFDSWKTLSPLRVNEKSADFSHSATGPRPCARSLAHATIRGMRACTKSGSRMGKLERFHLEAEDSIFLPRRNRRFFFRSGPGF